MRTVRLTLETLDIKEVIKQAGGGDFTSEIAIRDALDRAVRDALTLVDGRGIYQEFPASIEELGITITSDMQSSPFQLPFPGYNHIKGIQAATFFVVTIGDELEKGVEKAFQQKEPLDAMFLDTAGSVAVEAIADQLSMIIADELSRKGMKSSVRFSPGYCNWKMELQSRMFQLLDTSQVGVRLTPSLLMIPQKSMSGVVFHGKDLHPLNPCEGCSHDDCKDRR
jgi:hypothetical protein